MPRVKLRPYAVILDVRDMPNRTRRMPPTMTVRIWARDPEHAKTEAVDIYGGIAVASQWHPNPLS